MASSSRLPVLGESQEDNLRNSEVSPSPGPSVTANDFVEPHLLDGISLGFFSPVVSARTTRFAGPLPNVISLPYGKCAPLHMQAPNWRHLLKLMARLSGTRIEPTLDAVAVNKSELKLRTVIQFVKVHHASAEWRTLIWLTIDVPPHPGKDVTYTVSGEVLQRKYNAGDVSSLPYSYTLSTVPALLRDNPESALSKYYVIPSTTQLPYPTLPITFPDYAVYLQAALRESRKALHDSTSGMRRLARMVETCYPSEAESPDDDDEGKRRKMGVLFKRVIGRGNRPSRERFGNEDTYEMVTPFVINEWG
ncbi:hypothetical protein PLICRDRAFT_98028 [Plicaturopsis crispa FD-325 SS-3]|nr:hypothetical protein PLICRDRAFT_98028 [Plicaturopsis crispa FD-325 SS-3]